MNWPIRFNLPCMQEEGLLYASVSRTPIMQDMLLLLCGSG